MALRTIVGLTGTLLLWVGSFNSINYFLFVDSGKEYESGTVFQIAEQECTEVMHRNETLFETQNLTVFNSTKDCVEEAAVWEFLLKDFVCIIGGAALEVLMGTCTWIACMPAAGAPGWHTSIPSNMFHTCRYVDVHASYMHQICTCT